MKRKILFVIEVFLCCSLFAFILPGDAHLQAIMDAAREGCPVSIERSKTINTKYGKLSVVICYDINYPLFINSLSKKNIDILIVPSWDYPGVAEFQSMEARYKAI